MSRFASALVVCVLAGTSQLIATPPAESENVRPGKTPDALKSAVALREFSEQNDRSHENWSGILADIARHLPKQERYEDAFRRYMKAGDLVTAGHEWTHFLNEYLTLQNGTGKSCYYLLDGRYATLADPEGLRGIVPRIPSCLRGDLYNLYCVQNSSNARVDPLYLFDEWVAYTNDGAVAVAQLDEGKPLNRADDNVMQTRTAANLLEFTFYGFAVGMAVKAHDPQYYNSKQGQNLREFIAMNARRALGIYHRALELDGLSRDDVRNVSLLRNFRSSSETADMRAWVRSDLGADLSDDLGGVTGATAFASPSSARQSIPAPARTTDRPRLSRGL